MCQILNFRFVQPALSSKYLKRAIFLPQKKIISCIVYVSLISWIVQQGLLLPEMEN